MLLNLTEGEAQTLIKLVGMAHEEEGDSLEPNFTLMARLTNVQRKLWKLLYG